MGQPEAILVTCEKLQTHYNSELKAVAAIDLLTVHLNKSISLELSGKL